MSAPVRVAIIGGSIAGCTLANGLLKLPNVRFDLFDGKSSFRERGAGVAMAPNARKALHTMGIDAEKALKEAGGMEMNSTYCLIGFGEHKGKPILQLPKGVWIVDRGFWLDHLLQDLPEEQLHANKKLQSIDTAKAGGQGPYTLRFEDGTSYEADAVIGSDGVRSKMREIVLGPALRQQWPPKFGGYWDARGRITPQEAAEQFGTELFDPTSEISEVALVGHGAFLLFAPSNDQEVYHVVVSAKAGPGYDAALWKTDITREFLEESYKDWPERFRTGLVDALLSGPGVIFSEWESPPAPRYNSGALCVIGDAAHASIPWMGQGACLATEDAAVLTALLAKAQRPADLPVALQAFNDIRHGRPEYVITQSQDAAKLLTGQMSMNPADVQHLQAEKWWIDLWDIDMEEHVQAAVQRFEHLQGGA